MEAQTWQHSAAVPMVRLPEPLTEREITALDLAGNGLSIKGIAQVLGISSGTVSWHLKNAYQKLGVGCRDDALKKARAQHLIRQGTVCPACACKLG
jgi:ATP/maltotriose-dependent transcriptional regulator MalT